MIAFKPLHLTWNTNVGQIKTIFNKQIRIDTMLWIVFIVLYYNYFKIDCQE